MSPPRVVHVIHRLGAGGMENGLVNLINRTPPARYQHAIVCLTDSGPFEARITKPDVPVLSLHRRPGHSFLLYWKLWRALRSLTPSLVHTRNLAALEAQIPALFVPGAARVHGEHGRDVFDLHGASRKYNLLRRLIRPLVQRYIAVSKDLEKWLVTRVGVAPGRVYQIYNGVDTGRFRPRVGSRPAVLPEGFAPQDAFVVGTVGRLAEVKDQATLVRAFAQVLRDLPRERHRLRLVIVGDGPQRQDLFSWVRSEGIESYVWFAGERNDVPELMGILDLFVLPSLGEGISNTILEAMACALPVVATRVGGNPELVDEGVSGALVPVSDPMAMAEAIRGYVQDSRLVAAHGQAGLAKVQQQFRWDRCVEAYLSVYDELLGLAPKAAGAVALRGGRQ
jgi:sugar transferase (PEP-CTERM/EpsH1 system associated)